MTFANNLGAFYGQIKDVLPSYVLLICITLLMKGGGGLGIINDLIHTWPCLALVGSGLLSSLGECTTRLL